jgi:RHS repeat-associated protein
VCTQPANIHKLDPGALADGAAASSSVTFAYRYDPNNRRISQAANDNSWLLYPAGPTNTTHYTANNLNQYSAVGSVTPAYDGNGNLTDDGTFKYCYDAESRLTGILSAGTCASPTTTVGSYAYDAQGRRKLKTVGSVSTVYVTDADGREVLDYGGNTGALNHWYAYGLGPNTVLNQTNIAANTRLTLIPDVQGSVLATLDSGTAALTPTAYLAFGENTANRSGTFRYTAQRIDPETGGSASQPSGLYYYRARMYSPTLGRFLQADPVGYSAGVNLYAYVGNDPLNFTDPSGLVKDAAGAASNWLNTPLTADAYPVPDVSSCGICIAHPEYAVAGDYAEMSFNVRPLTNGDALQGGLDFASIATLGLGGGIGRAADAAADTTILFRAVTAPELESIRSLNAFTNPAGIEVKYFSTSLEGAQSYASQAKSAFGDGPFSFVQTSIPTSSITPQMSVTVDRGIQTIVVPTGQLPGLSPVILPRQ